MPLCLGASRFGAGEHEAPIGPVGLAGPHLLPLDHPLAVDQLGAGLDVGQIGPGAGLAVALAPELGAVDDPGKEAVALRVGAERDQRGPEEGLADVADAPRGAGPGVLLEVHDLLVERQAAAAVLLRPRHTRPAVGTEVALPRQALVEQAVVIAGPAPTRATAKSSARLSSRNVRTSSRNASSSLLNRRSMRATLPLDLTPRQIPSVGSDAGLTLGPHQGAVEVGVEAAGQQELVVRALLDDVAVVEHEDLVGRHDGGQPVGDHEARAAR